MAVKQWFVPDGLFKPLCSNNFQPVEGQNSCPVCAVPVKVAVAVENQNVVAVEIPG